MHRISAAFKTGIIGYTLSALGLRIRRQQRSSQEVAMTKRIDVVKTGMLGCGLALAVTSAAQAGGFKVVHHFAGGSSDGAFPNEVLPQDSDHLYLTTYMGGETGEGTVSMVGNDGSVTILHSFGHADPYDGAYPAGSLCFEFNPDGTYAVAGTTAYGGQPNYGTIFYVGIDGSE
ncbi:MAG TPA: choice-of-anchor tandem repeat GloVer-containing protein [Rhizomicrobium sp.]|jgi:uncharacterized repeat protein (TIGR03803 family)|nr:choice-of-anchor tandem repeat GloVer-containing protein [Rhizomicrobium sp.]